MIDLTDEEIRKRAKEWASEVMSRSFNEAKIAIIHQHIDTISLTLAGMPYCPACECVLCGYCGDCHMWDIEPDRPECPAYSDAVGLQCVLWWQALNATQTVQHDRED